MRVGRSKSSGVEVGNGDDHVGLMLFEWVGTLEGAQVTETCTWEETIGMGCAWNTRRWS